tara:strand:+ start:4143 stop:4784 length:642 start_codon:yes stop_codon:yes gene_type:complete
MSESYSNVTSKGVPFDLKLNKEIFFEKENGFFIELGAYDGLTQSNTAFFEKTKNWTGILIEASRDRYEECVKNRPNSKCVNTACSATDNASISFNHENGLMSKVVDDGVYSCDTSTLETILDNCEVDRNIDFLSLDVEGHELEVLEGLNLCKYRPNYMLIELWDDNEFDVKTLLYDNNYRCLGNYSKYNTRDNPSWGDSGYHNDYLFEDKLLE